MLFQMFYHILSDDVLYVSDFTSDIILSNTQETWFLTHPELFPGKDNNLTSKTFSMD